MSLVVNLICCMDLIPMDSDGKSDPFVTLSIGGEIIKSTVKKDTLDPFYNETFYFDHINAREKLKIEVTDWDLIGKNDFLGSCSVYLDALPNGQRIVDTFKLEDVKNGCVVLGLELRGKYLGSESPWFPNLRYLKIGGKGKKGEQKWEDSEWTEDFEMLCMVYGNGNVYGKYKVDSTKDDEWDEVEGIYNEKEGYIDIRSSKIYFHNKHVITSSFKGKISSSTSSSTSNYFEGSGKSVLIKTGGEKKYFCRGEFSVSPYHPRLQIHLKEVELNEKKKREKDVLDAIEHQSVILSETFLYEELKKSCGFDYHWKLLYRASKHGRNQKIFHKKCDGVYNTLVIVQSSHTSPFSDSGSNNTEQNKKIRILGGFNPLKWDLDEGNHYHRDAWVFGFDDKKLVKFEYRKIPYENYSIYCNKNYGPVFGAKKDPALEIEGNGKHGSSTLNVEEREWFDKGYGPFFLHGGETTKDFEVIEIEVFSKV